MTTRLVPRHNRYDYSPITERKDYSWPGGKRLAFCLTTNVEVYAYGRGRGHDNAKHGEPQTQRNYAWRDYGNRVGIWRLLELFEALSSGKFRLKIGATYALADAAQAHRDLEARRTTGSTLLIP